MRRINTNRCENYEQICDADLAAKKNNKGSELKANKQVLGFF